jgi:YVTN family beta-propeller protein
VEGIFTTAKVHNIYMMISLAVLVYASITSFSHHAEAALPLSFLGDEGDVNPEIFLDRSPSSIAVGNDGSIFVSHPDDDVISVIAGDTFMVSTIPVGSRPRGIAVDPFSNLVFVANYESNTVSVIERTHEGYRTIANVTSGGIHPYDVFTQEFVSIGEVSSIAGNIIY